MYLSNMSNNIYFKTTVQVCKKDNYKSANLLAIYKAHFESEPGNHRDRFAVAVLQGEYTVGHITRVFKSCLVLPETWRRDHLQKSLAARN